MAPPLQTRLEPQSAHWPDQQPHPSTGAYGIIITARDELGIVNFRGGSEQTLPIAKCFGTALPETPNQFTVAGERMALWLSPDEYLLLLADADEAEFSRSAHALMKGQFFALNTVSDAFRIYEVTGDKVRQMLAKGISLDLHPVSFKPLCCAQTSLSHAAVTLICMADNRFRLICRTSFSDYLESWLKDASIEFGYQLVRP